MKIRFNFKSSNFLILLFFLPYFGSTFFVYIFIYIYVCFHTLKIKLPSWELFLLLLYPIFIICKVQQVGMTNGELIFRFFWGYIPMYYFFRISKIRIDLKKFIYILCYVIIIEAILINTVISPTLLGNYPNQDIFDISHQTSFFGFYQRPYGIGCNPTITSSILCLSLIFFRTEAICTNDKWDKRIDFLSLIAVLLLASGTGFVLYTIYLFYRYRLLSIKYSLIGILVICSIYFAISNVDFIGTESVFKKVSLDYIDLLFDYKQEQMIETMKELNSTSLLLGSDFSNTPLLLWNDFAIRDFFHSFGILGAIVFCLFILCRLNKYNSIFIIVAIVSLFHYGSIFSFAGQMLFAYILRCSEEISKQSNLHIR